MTIVQRCSAGAHFLLSWFAALLMAGVFHGAARAQLLERALLISHARIRTMSGDVIEDGAIIIKGGRITAIGSKLATPLFPRILNAKGRTVTPGLIDVYSFLGMTSGRSSTAKATSRAEDAFDRFAAEALREALKNGVTAVYVSPRGAVGIHGTGAVVRLLPGEDGTIGEVLQTDADLGVDLGSSQQSIARIRTFNSVRKQFRDALDYRRAREDYEEDLGEYEKKLNERAAKKAEGKEGKGTPGDEKPSGTAEDPKKEEKPGTSSGDKEKKTDALKKPAEPPRKPQLEVLLSAIDRELRVRVEAHRSEDILNALDLAEEFSLDVILVGATDAHLVADEISARETRVVLGNMLETELYRDGPYRRWLPENGAVLGRAGVSWWVGSGARADAEARFVLVNAQIASASGGGDDALSLVTSRAADLLQVEGEIGRLRTGMHADLVIWSGDPLAPGSRVDEVLVGGKLAYDAEAGK